MADELQRRPVLNPILRFTKDPKPEGVTGGGKGRAGIQQGRLEKQRSVLASEFLDMAKNADRQPGFAGRAIIRASMFDDSMAATWTPNDLFHPDRGAQLLAPFRDGYLIEVTVAYLDRLARLVQTATNTRDMVDISRVKQVRFHSADDALYGHTLNDIWMQAPETDRGRLFIVWFMPFTNAGAAEHLLQTVGSFKDQFFAEPPPLMPAIADDRSPIPLERSLRTLAATDRLSRALRDYRQTRHARTTLAIPSLESLEAITASGAVYRIEPVAPVVITSPGSGREPDRPIPDNIENEPIVGVVDGGLTAPSYLAAEAWRAPPLVSGAAAEVMHGNRITSVIVQGHEWNNNLVLPQLYCRVGTVAAIAKVGHPSPDPEQLIAYLDAVIGAHPDTRVWNLSFNQGYECEVDAVSFLGHALSEIARKHEILFINSVGNQPGSSAKAPADCEAAITVGGRLHDDKGMPAGPCSVALSGPGPSSLLKPDVSHFSNVRALGGSVQQGSSFSTALVSPLAAHTLARLREPDPDLARALLIHTTDGDGFDPSLGFGTPGFANLPWECRSGSVTLQWRATLRARAAYYWELPIPPALLVGDRLRGRGRLTAVLNPHPLVTDFAGPNYFGARLNTALQAPRGEGYTNLLGSMDTDKIAEQIARSVDHKWCPVRDHMRDFSRIGVRADGNNLRVYARVYTRDHYLYGYQNPDEIPELSAVFALTLMGMTDSDDIYNQTRTLLGNFVESAVVVTEIDVE